MKLKLTVLIMLAFLVGCAGMYGEGGILDIDSNTTQSLIIEQSIDTFGYTLGLFAVKDPDFRGEVEYYYNQVKTSGFTLTVVNEIMYKFKNKDIAYQVLMYKMTSLIRILGGKIDSNGAIESFGEITDHYLEIGKNAYMIAVQNAEGRP